MQYYETNTETVISAAAEGPWGKWWEHWKNKLLLEAEAEVAIVCSGRKSGENVES